MWNKEEKRKGKGSHRQLSFQENKKICFFPKFSKEKYEDLGY